MNKKYIGFLILILITVAFSGCLKESERPRTVVKYLEISMDVNRSYPSIIIDKSHILVTEEENNTDGLTIVLEILDTDFKFEYDFKLRVNYDKIIFEPTSEEEYETNFKQRNEFIDWEYDREYTFKISAVINSTNEDLSDLVLFGSDNSKQFKFAIYYEETMDVWEFQGGMTERDPFDNQKTYIHIHSDLSFYMKHIREKE
jgi:hypothetical protein